LRGLDAFQTENHRIEHSEEGLTKAVPIVSLRHTDLPCERMLETDAGQEPMDEVHAAVMGQRLGVKVHAQPSSFP
jgi:hypothetical protein